MRLIMMMMGEENVRWEHARQMGIRGVVTKLAPEVTGQASPDNLPSLREAVKRYAAAGFEIVALEGDQLDMSRIKRGLPGRDQDIDRYQQMLRNMGTCGILTLCYNFMVGIQAYRTTYARVDRGGAKVSAYDRAESEANGSTEIGTLPTEQVFANYRYFIEAVLPVAEQVGVRMGLHPDDPPVPSLRGIGRPFGTKEGFDRAMALSASPSHGITFCQGSFASAGLDVPALIREWGGNGRIAFAHFRDVLGTRENFHETFPDIGQTDQRAVARAYAEIGYQGAIRPDHAPAMSGDPTEGKSRGRGYDMAYSPGGMIFTTAYLRGLFEGVGYPLVS